MCTEIVFDIQNNSCSAKIRTSDKDLPVKEVDPYGWFMWYCRFYLGRRCEDDERQIGRWKNCTGPKGKRILFGTIQYFLGSS